MTRLSISTLYRQIKAGSLRSFKVRNGMLIARAELDRFLDAVAKAA
ncbi:MAG: helix-turn-helix domain-containing protein [Caulobacteraceae bacterium]